MRHYQQIYEEAVSKLYKSRSEYTKTEYETKEEAKYNKYKKVKKDIWYFYLIGIVVVGIVLMIFCVRKIELFSKVWSIYFVVLALNSMIMYITLTIIKQIMDQKGQKSHEKVDELMQKTVELNDELAKLSICLTAIDKNSCFLASIDDEYKRKIALETLIYEYKNVMNHKNSDNLTSDDAILYYKEEILAFEKRKNA